MDEKLRAVGFTPLMKMHVFISDGKVQRLRCYCFTWITLFARLRVDILMDLVQYLSLFKLKLMGVPSVLVDMPVPSQLLGLDLIWGAGFRSIQINSNKFVRELLKMHYKDSGTKSNKVPVDPTFKFSKDDVLIDNGDLSNADKAMQSAYRTIVGVAIFLVTMCRVDISYATTQLARYISKPGYRHYRAASFLLSYFSGAVDLGIAFYSSGSRRINAYVDSDFGSDESRKACAVFILANGPIRWKYAFSKEVPLSTCEAEVRIVSAMVEPIKDCICIDKVFDSLGLGEEYRKGSVKVHSSIDSTAITPLVVYDNQAAIAWSSNPVLSQKMRHVDRGLMYVRQEIVKKTFSLVWVETANQIADMFTKALVALVFWRFVNMIMISAERYREENEIEGEKK